MTTVTFRRYYDRILIIVDGHTGFATRGKDVVCAGVSTLVYTLLNSVADEEAGERVKVKRNIVRDGYVCIEYEPFDFAKERVEGITDMFLTGIYMLSENYPQNIILE